MHLLTGITIKRLLLMVVQVKRGVYMCTECDDVSCRWLVTKSIVRPSEVLSDIRTLRLAHYYSYRPRIPVASELAHKVVALTYS